MFETFCMFLGLACWDGERPPLSESARLEPPVINTGQLSAPKLEAPKIVAPSFFDAGCEAQPPNELKPIYWSAAQRFPSITDCQLAMQGKAECHICWTRGDYTIASPVGAIGVAQFLPGTAAELGVDPHDPRQSIFGQARYVDWCRRGWNPNIEGRTDKDIRSLGYCCYNYGRKACFDDQARNGWNLYLEAKPHLPRETQGYIKRIEDW